MKQWGRRSVEICRNIRDFRPLFPSDRRYRFHEILYQLDVNRIFQSAINLECAACDGAVHNGQELLDIVYVQTTPDEQRNTYSLANG